MLSINHKLCINHETLVVGVGFGEPGAGAGDEVETGGIVGMEDALEFWSGKIVWIEFLVDDLEVSASAIFGNDIDVITHCEILEMFEDTVEAQSIVLMASNYGRAELARDWSEFVPTYVHEVVWCGHIAGLGEAEALYIRINGEARDEKSAR